jgi:peptidoglycan hydrolase-like protein with peptidoglycan-binding domain
LSHEFIEIRSLPALARSYPRSFTFYLGNSFPRFISLQEQSAFGLRYNRVSMRVLLLAVAIGFAVAASVWANEEVRAVQEKLRDGGFYSGEMDGAYSADLSAALTRYQIRNGLPITGQLDADTSKALGAKPAVTNGAADADQSSETWRRLRSGAHKTSAKAQKTSSPTADETQSSAEMQPRSTAAATAQASSETMQPASAAPAIARTSSEITEPGSAPPAIDSVAGVSTERLRDYVGAFVLAGVDPHAGSEADFFADRVRYYDQGVIGREQIRNDLQNYAARWPERRFWFVGNITIEPQRRNRVRVTFPLQYELRNGATQSSGRINKTLVLEPVGDDLQIIAVDERKAE